MILIGHTVVRPITRELNRTDSIADQRQRRTVLIGRQKNEKFEPMTRDRLRECAGQVDAEVSRHLRLRNGGVSQRVEVRHFQLRFGQRHGLVEQFHSSRQISPEKNVGDIQYILMLHNVQRIVKHRLIASLRAAKFI